MSFKIMRDDKMNKMPLIGISCGIDYDKGYSYLKQGYYRALQKSGALVVLLTADEGGNESQLLKRLDGILLTGGPDVDPVYFGEESYTFNGNISPDRDRQEIALAKLAFADGKPILGICRGAQVLNVAMGGTIYQDIKTQVSGKNLLKHDQEAPKWYPSHNIMINKDSRVFECFGEETARVNSFHHQAVKDVAQDFKATANSSDGIIEAIEYIGDQYAIGVQWHPETMWEKDNRYLEIFKAFVKVCAEDK